MGMSYCRLMMTKTRQQHSRKLERRILAMNITLDLLKEQIIAAKTLEEAEQGMK